MAKKQDSPCQNENSSGAAKFGHTLSFLSVLICSAVLVRVEIVNQRVDTVENSLVEIRLQNPDTNFHGFGESFRQEKRERYISGLNLNDQDVGNLEAGKCDLKNIMIRGKVLNSERRNLTRYHVYDLIACSKDSKKTVGEFLRRLMFFTLLLAKSSQKS